MCLFNMICNEFEFCLKRVLCIMVTVCLIALLYALVFKPAMESSDDDPPQALINAWKKALKTVKKESEQMMDHKQLKN
ncbi:hypothetical protein MTO96_031366 [Rhipicephalus appendiculatus]